MVRATFPSFFSPWSATAALLESLSRRADLFADSTPPLEMWSGDEGLIVRLALPGLDPASIDVALEENHLRVRAMHADRGLGQAREVVRELPTAKVDLSFELPFRPADEGVAASYELGILELKLPRPAEERPRRIQVQSR